MLRARVAIALLNPVIPHNTGAIGRTALGFNCEFHVIKPIGFSLQEKDVKRAGLDYWHHCSLQEHESWSDFAKGPLNDFDHKVLFTKFGTQSLFEHKFPSQSSKEGCLRESRILLLFGNEIEGVPTEKRGI